MDATGLAATALLIRGSQALQRQALAAVKQQQEAAQSLVDVLGTAQQAAAAAGRGRTLNIVV
jgi:hypothetical protein